MRKKQYKTCAEPLCENKIEDHAWGYIKSSGENGWFHQFNGDSWCPEHIPEWVAGWRERKNRNA